jgi:glycosyltransferase involved in cell wall biosynthesis
MTESPFPLVSVLFITYKRFEMLEQSLCRFRENTDYPNLQLVIADDGSGPDIQAKIRTLPADIFALMPKNRGLGANNNNGLRHCTGKYILMIQDDCICRGPRDYLRNTVLVMEANPGVGIVNYCGAPHPIDESRMLAGGTEPCYVTPRAYENAAQEYFLYTDQPHVISRAALEHVGYYLELRDMEECERDYNRRWRDQSRFATAVMPGYYKKLYVHQGVEQSFRTSRFRYRVQRALQPLKPALESVSPALFRRAKSFVNWTLRGMERIRMVR